MKLITNKKDFDEFQKVHKSQLSITNAIKEHNSDDKKNNEGLSGKTHVQPENFEK